MASTLRVVVPLPVQVAVGGGVGDPLCVKVLLLVTGGAGVCVAMIRVTPGPGTSMPVPSPVIAVTARMTGKPLAVETDTLPLRVITTAASDVEAGRMSVVITP